MMQVGSPIFKETAEYRSESNSDLALNPTGLEPYVFGGMELGEVVRFMASYGIRDQKGLKRYFAEDGYSAVKRADELLVDGKVDPRNAKRDLRILTFEDVSAGTIVARLRGGMTPQAEAFREETHRLVGNPRTRYKVDGEGSSRIAAVNVPISPRHSIGERVSLREALAHLTSEELSGWLHMVKLFRGTIKGPHARLFLKELRSTFLPL
jgi:hypothetical protein